MASDPALRRSIRCAGSSRPGPTIPALRLEIGERYFDLAMAQGDPRYVGYAIVDHRAAGHSRRPATPATGWCAGCCSSTATTSTAPSHSLSEASELAPHAVEPVAWRAAIHMVQAQYALAAAECDRLVADRAAAVRAGLHRLRARQHRPAACPPTSLLSKAVAAAPDVPPGWRCGRSTRLAEMAVRLQRWGDAERHFTAARWRRASPTSSCWAPTPTSCSSASARREVLQLLAGWERSDILLLRLALAGRAANDPRAADWAAQLRDRFEAAAQRGDRLHEQEAARFDAGAAEGDPARALACAKSNYTQQKEPRDAEILLRAALAARQPQAAQPALDWLRANRLRGPGAVQRAGRSKLARRRAPSDDSAGCSPLARCCCCLRAAAWAHKPSDSYLTLRAAKPTTSPCAGTSPCATSTTCCNSIATATAN